MNDIAPKITERLYGDDKIKCELIFYILNNTKKIFDDPEGYIYDECIKSLSKGDLDEYLKGSIELYEEYFDLEEMVNHIREFGLSGLAPLD